MNCIKFRIASSDETLEMKTLNDLLSLIETSLMGLMLVLFFISFDLKAVENIYCDELATQTCTEGSVEDGTGSVNRKPSEVHDFKSIVKQYETESTEHFQTQLPLDKDFQKKALSLFKKPSTCMTSPDCLKDIALKTAQACAQSALQAIDTSPLGSFYAYAQQKHKLKDRIKNQVLGSDYHKKIQSVFDKIKPLIINKVTTLVADSDSRKKPMLNKLDQVKFNPDDCEVNPMSRSPIEYIENARYYDESKTVRVCSGLLLGNTSVFPLAFVLAHEIAHSIDPCRFPKDFNHTEQKDAELDYPFKGVLAKLRTFLSVSAQRTKPWDPEKGFCEGDQINEAFSDWLAIEVLPEYIELAKKDHPELVDNEAKMRAGYSNVFRPLCLQKAAPADEHPDWALRTNSLLMVQPLVREHMKCTSSAHRKYRRVNVEKTKSGR